LALLTAKEWISTDKGRTVRKKKEKYDTFFQHRVSNVIKVLELEGAKFICISTNNFEKMATNHRLGPKTVVNYLPKIRQNSTKTQKTLDLVEK
jgi:protein associated with RNAse G/E